MKLKVDERQAHRDGSLTEKVFNVKTSPQAFKILADNLYSRKDEAVVRELTCNSHDSHIQKYGDKANEVSIDIHIPNYIERWFSIRDYGNGMSHDFMMGEIEANGQKVGYCTAFHSSKSESNDESGLYGLGKLAVLSITDSYSITSITYCPESNTNVKRFYTVCRERGYPVIIFMGESETDEKTGVEIKAPISNYSKFENEAIRFLSNLDIKFNISGTTLRPKTLEVTLNRSTWRVFKRENSYSTGVVMAKIGIVRYPIDNNFLPRELQYKSIEIDFPIGSLEITPSREALSYDESTVELIRKRAEGIIEEIRQEFNSKLAAAANLWEARKLIYSLSSGELSQFSSLITDCRYKDAPIYSSIKLPNYRVNKFFIKTSYRRGSNRETLTSYAESSITANDNTVFAIDESIECVDVQEGAIDQNTTSIKITYPRKRIEKYLETNPEADFYVFGQKTYDDLKKSGVLEGAPDPVYLSKLPFDPIVRVKSDPKTKKVFDAGEVYYVSNHSTHGGGSYDSYRLWSDNSALPKEGYYIVAGKNERYMLNGYNNQYPKKLGFCKELDIKTDYVFAIHPRKEKSFLKQYPDWKLATELDEKIKKELDKRLKGVIVERVNSTLMEFLRGFVAVKEFHSNPKVSKLKTLVDGYDDKRYQNLEQIAGFYGVKIPESLEISNTYTELYENYPLLWLAGGQMYKIEEYKAEWAKYLGC